MSIYPILLLASVPVFPFAARTVDIIPTPSNHIKVVFRGTNGPLRIVCGRDRQIVVKKLTRADKQSKLSEVVLEEKWGGSELSLLTKENLTTPGDPANSYVGATTYHPPFIETTLYVPKGTDLDIENTNASVSVDTIGGFASVKSYNGTINFAATLGQVGAISAKTYNGSIHAGVPLVSSSSASVRLESYNGNISVSELPASLLLKGASVFQGSRFVRQDWYVVDGRFTRSKPTGNIETLDLTGKFILPPYGDAHCHHIDGAGLSKAMNAKYLAEGTLYVQSMTNHTSLRTQSDTVVNKPDSIDVAYSNAGFTTDMGHPSFLYESLAHPVKTAMTPKERSDYIRSQSRTQAGDVYWVAETPEQLDEIWPHYLASDPDVTKIFLVDTMHRAENIHALAGTFGIDPLIVPHIVKKAHAAGLRVYAHVDTAYDFQIAMEAGVDGTAHMPGYGMGSESADNFLIDEATAKLATGRTIQPTLQIAADYAKTDRLSAVHDAQRKNLEKLRKAGARFVVGSDSFSKTQVDEAKTWTELGFSFADTLRALVEFTPQSIFPFRAIGRIGEGYEGSFVVLDSNPLTKFEATFKPEAVFKRGRPVYRAK